MFITRKSIILVGVLFASTVGAKAQGCAIEDLKLKCDGKSASAITEALAADQTTEALSNPIGKLDMFKRPIDLEIFRRSVERNWRAVKRTENFKRNQMRRRQISGNQYDSWSATYKKAATNYGHAISLYRTLVWHGKNGKPAPIDSDS